MRPSEQNKPPTNTTERHENRWHNALEMGASTKHSADKMAGIHEATAIELDGNVSRISTNSTPYDFTRPATQNWTQNAPNTTSHPNPPSMVVLLSLAFTARRLNRFASLSRKTNKNNHNDAIKQSKKIANYIRIRIRIENHLHDIFYLFGILTCCSSIHEIWQSTALP